MKLNFRLFENLTYTDTKVARKFFIHLGPTKTGSSAIQAFFRDGGTKEVLYPETGRWPDGSHHKLVFAHRGIERYGLNDIPPWSQLFESLEREISNSEKNILISSEICQVDFVTSLLPIVEKYGLDLQLILVIRDPLERAESLYNQMIKDPVIGLNEYPDEFLVSMGNHFRTELLYNRWISICKNVITIPYGDTLPLVQRVCLAIGFSIDADNLERRYNRSMGGHALIALLIANNLLEEEVERRVFFEQLRDDRSFMIWSGDSFPFGRKACENFLESNKLDNAWVESNLGIRFKSLAGMCPHRFKLSKTGMEKINFHLDQFGVLTQNKECVSAILEHFSN